MHYLGPRVRSARLLRSLMVRTLALVSPLSIAPDARVPNRWQVVRSRNALVENLLEYTCARMMGEHCKILPAAHPVSALEINSGAPPATLSPPTRRRHCMRCRCCKRLAALLAPSQNICLPRRRFTSRPTTVTAQPSVSSRPRSPASRSSRSHGLATLPETALGST